MLRCEDVVQPKQADRAITITRLTGWDKMGQAVWKVLLSCFSGAEALAPPADAPRDLVDPPHTTNRRIWIYLDGFGQISMAEKHGFQHGFPQTFVSSKVDFVF